ncbi:YdcF family protein [Nakamurella silvestris]|nr:YdcF family protein [Nakamurella silvestris]
MGSAGRAFGRYLAGGALVLVLVVAGVVVKTLRTASQDQRATADVIIVLGAAQYNGTPSTIFANRLDHAAALFDEGVAPVIMTIGGSQQGDNYTEAEAGRGYLEGKGIPESAIVPVGEGNDTLVSLRAAAVELTGRGWDSVVLVTDPWHAYRSSVMARDLGMQVQVSSVETGPGTPAGASGRYLWRETFGTLFYRVIGGPTGSRTGGL